MSSHDTPSPQEQEFDRAFAAKLAEFPVPADLEAKLLALGKTAGAEPQLAEIIRPNAFKRYWPVAAAAAVLVVLGIGSLIVPAPVEFPAVVQADGATYRDHMAFFANSRFWLDEMTDDPAAAQTALRESGTPVFASVPAGLQPLGTMGCKSIEWAGRKVGLVCFTKENGEIVHLFTADKSGFAETELAGLMTPETTGDLRTAGWSDDEYVYMLVGSKPGIEVAGYLPTV